MSQRFIDGLLLRDSGTGPGTQSSPRGPIGPDGEPGEDGLRGPPGPAGPTGATGDPGDPGASGTTGPTGATGSRGPIGSDGIDGEDGLRGPAGPAGIAGAAGMRGMAGEDGDEGPMGPVAQIATVTQPSEMSSTQFWHCRGGFGEWTTTASGAGSGSYTGATDHIGPTLNADGQWGMQTGTTATGYCSIYHAPFCAFGGGTVYEFACRLTVGSLSTAAEEYAFTAGFGDAFATTGEPVDGAYFIYRRATDGDFWVCCTRSNSTETKTVTAVAPTTYSGQTKLRTEVSGDGARVQFWIAGVLVATHTSNIPTGSSRLTGMGLKFEKSAGTTSRFAYADWISLRSTRSAST